MTTVLRGARLLRPGRDGVVVDEGDVVVADRIVAIGDTPADGSVVVDLQGLTLLPGLIDVHTHASDVEALETYLRAGVTTVRLSGSAPGAATSLARSAAAAGLVGPRLLSCGPMLDAAPPAWPEGTIVMRGPADAASAVGSVVADGADALILGPRLDPPTVAAIVAEGHAMSLPVTSQTWTTSARECLAAGIDGLENTARIPEVPERDERWLHGYRSVPERLGRLMTLWVEADARALDDVLDLMVASSVDWAPELSSFALWSGAAERIVRELPLARSVPRGALPGAPTRQTEGWTQGDRDVARSAITRMQEAVSRYVQGGGRLAVGTDARPGGLFTHVELSLLSDAGLTHERTLAAATWGGATALRRDDLGRLDVGAQADLLAVEGDPLRDLAALQAVRHVWVAGQEADLLRSG